MQPIACLAAVIVAGVLTATASACSQRAPAPLQTDCRAFFEAAVGSDVAR